MTPTSTTLHLAAMALYAQEGADALLGERPDWSASLNTAALYFRATATAIGAENYPLASLQLDLAKGALWKFQDYYIRQCVCPMLHESAFKLTGIGQSADGSWVNGMVLVKVTEEFKLAQEMLLLGVAHLASEPERLRNLPHE